MLKLLRPGTTELSPLVLTLNLPDGYPSEMPEIRILADSMIERFDRQSCHTTANTIFPTSLWAPGVSRQMLYERYSRILPRLRKCPLNQYGLYFDRLIAHGGTVNQLEHILTTYEGGNHRRSALQAAIFDPARDHTDQRQRGFPCLQNVTFAPAEDGLTVCGVYAIQSVFDRAYGNYLGLCQLGRFMAHEMNMPLRRMHCVTTFANLGTPAKRDLNEMGRTLASLLQQSEPAPGIHRGDLMLEVDGFTLLDELVLEKDGYAQAR